MTPMSTWEEECMHFYNKVLDGEYRHYCYEWDGLPIDETCFEYKCCTCFFEVMKEKDAPTK